MRATGATGRPFTDGDAADALVSLRAAGMVRPDGRDRWVPGPLARFADDLLDDDVKAEWLLARGARRDPRRPWR